MKFESTIDQKLIFAYEATHFQVKTNPAFTLNVNKESRELRSLFKKNKATNAAFISAWNPYGKSLSVEDNQSRNEQLKNVLIIRNLKFIEGFGQDPLAQWSGEESFLILGIDLEESKKLGAQFEQNAVIWSDIDAVPKLILLR